MNRLNTEQQEAVKAASDGHVAVIAGAGTGKTHTLISVAAHLLERNVPAEQMLILTFTNKAADELTARLKESRSGKLPRATTFHAWAYQQIKDDMSDKKLIDTFTQRQVLMELKKQTGTKQTVRELGLMMSRCKNESDHSQKNLALLKAYDALLARDGLIDFDDLLRLYFKTDHATRYTNIFVDEFQDTSPLQYRLLQRFAGSGAKLFVIGDPNQSIYGFRGAYGEVFDSLIDDYQPTVIRLTHNYRSAQAIVEAAAAIFPEAQQQPTDTHQGSVRIIETLDAFSEADYIIRTIEQSLGGTDWAAVHHDERQLAAAHFRDFAVLYRHNRQGKRLAEKLRGAGLPVQVTGEDSPYATPLAQAVLSAFIYLADPNEDTKQLAIHAARMFGTKDSLAWLDRLDGTQLPVQVASVILEYLGKADANDFQPVLNSLSQQPDLAAATTYWQGLAEQDFYDPSADCVTLSTIHAAKGLEFRHVFVAGCNDGVLPHERGDLAEEKRLFYVALTRAIESLCLLHCRKADGKQAEVSRFISDLPAFVERQLDPELAATEKRRERNRQKRAQQSLF